MTRYARASWRVLDPARSLALFVVPWLAVLAAAAALVLGGCATQGGPPDPGALLKAAASSLGTLDEQVGQAAFAGRITSAKATALLDESARIRKQMSEARELLRGCEPEKPCAPFDASLRAINDRLLEAQCRRRQAEAKLPEDACKLPPRSPA